MASSGFGEQMRGGIAAFICCRSCEVNCVAAGRVMGRAGSGRGGLGKIVELGWRDGSAVYDHARRGRGMFSQRTPLVVAVAVAVVVVVVVAVVVVAVAHPRLRDESRGRRLNDALKRRMHVPKHESSQQEASVRQKIMELHVSVENQSENGDGGRRTAREDGNASFSRLDVAPAPLAHCPTSPGGVQ